MGKKDMIKIIGITSIIYGIIFLLIIGGLYFYGISSQGFSKLSQIGAFHPSIVGMLSIVILIYILFIVAGFGFLKYKNWARILLIILSIITIFNFPIGTGISIWFLIYLFNSEIKSLMREYYGK